MIEYNVSYVIYIFNIYSLKIQMLYYMRKGIIFCMNLVRFKIVGRYVEVGWGVW